MKDLYQNTILDHNKNPSNYYEMKNATYKLKGHNPLCGDHLILYLKLKKNIIEEISFLGQGCAISIASASLMTEYVKGKSVEQSLQLFSQIKKLLTSNDEITIDIGKLKVLQGVRGYPARVKCAMLIWRTLEAIVTGKTSIISTE